MSDLADIKWWTVRSRIHADDVVRTTGATYRQIDYWSRVGWLRPARDGGEGSGHFRLWSAVDLRLIRVLVALTRAGVSPGAVAPQVAAAIYETADGSRAQYLAVFAGADGVRAVLTLGQPVVPQGEAMWLMRLPSLELLDIAESVTDKGKQGPEW